MGTSKVNAHLRQGRVVRAHTRTGAGQNPAVDIEQAASAAGEEARRSSGAEQADDNPLADGRPVLCNLSQLRTGDIVRIPGFIGNQRVVSMPVMLPESFDMDVVSVVTGDRNNVGMTRSASTKAERLASPDSVGLSGSPVKLDSGEWGVRIPDPDGGIEEGDVLPCQVVPRSRHTKPWMQMTEVIAISEDDHGNRFAHGREAP